MGWKTTAAKAARTSQHCSRAVFKRLAFTGLLMYSSMPASRHFSRSPVMALAVRAMMYGRRGPSGQRRRISRVASRPSISGIWMSMRTTSYSLASSACTASSPLLVEVAVYPRLFEQAECHALVDHVVLGDEDAQVAVDGQCRLGRVTVDGGRRVRAVGSLDRSVRRCRHRSAVRPRF